MATTYLSRTAGTPTDSKKCTLSVWLKRSGLGTGTFFGGGSDSSNMTFINFNPNGKIFLQSSASGSNTLVFTTTQVFKDTSGWYNIVVAMDTTQATASNRVKLYVNGVQVTAFDTETYPSQNLELEWNKSGKTLEIGKYLFQSSYSLYDGSMSHYNFIDGTAYAPTEFGETDSTTGEWKINTSPSVTYGNNGFFILKNDNVINDQSGNANNFTLGGGTLTNTEDCPSNVFATLNPLSYQVASQMSAPPTNGNTTLVSGSGSAWGTLISTIGATTGKYYFEAKLITLGSNCIVGAVDINDNRSDGSAEWYIGQSSTGQGYQNNGAASNGGASYGATYTNGDIIGVAMDLDNNKIYWSKNGTFQNSGVPTSGSTGTGALNLTAGTTYAFALTGFASTTWYSNFGNGYFSTGAVASAGTNASGIGIFEYDVPTGYTALTTKGLNV